MGEDLEKQRTEAWVTLVHVCRRWRCIIFQAPRRLNLRLVCTPKLNQKDTLDIWPPLPLIIRDAYEDGALGVDNTIAALEHNDRVCQIQLLSCSYARMKYVTKSAAMKKPFPKLTLLNVCMTDDEDGPVLPNSFLGRTAPHLQSLKLFLIPFPGLPKLLSSATHLVILDLFYNVRSGYIPPKAMAIGLSALTSLEFLRLHFEYSPPALKNRRPPPLTRSILPNLTTMLFVGVSGYLEEILARVDAPRLNRLRITFFNQFTRDTPQLLQFISRKPTLRAPKKGYITFGSNFTRITTLKFLPQTTSYGALIVEIPYTELELQQLSSQVYALPPLSTLEDLYIHGDPSLQPWRLDNVENMLWLRLLHPFAVVKNLYLCEKFVPHFAPALQEPFGRRTAEVLPILENIFLEGFRPSRPCHEGIVISHWDRDPENEREWKSYEIYDR